MQICFGANVVGSLIWYILLREQYNEDSVNRRRHLKFSEFKNESTVINMKIE